jgi:hypothetical protein
MSFISYTCGVLYVLTLAAFPVYWNYALLRRWRVFRWRFLGVRAPDHLPVAWCLIPLFRPLDLIINCCNKTWCIKHWLYCLFHYLSLYVWNLFLIHIKVMHSVLALKLGVTNGLFMKKCWDTIKGEFCRILSQFYQGNTNLEFINGSFINLIPKKDNPRTVNDFKPVSPQNSSFKLLTKHLATRL